jgi:hypothetical protein
LPFVTFEGLAKVVDSFRAMVLGSSHVHM